MDTAPAPEQPPMKWSDKLGRVVGAMGFVALGVIVVANWPKAPVVTPREASEYSCRDFRAHVMVGKSLTYVNTVMLVGIVEESQGATPEVQAAARRVLAAQKSTDDTVPATHAMDDACSRAGW